MKLHLAENQGQQRFTGYGASYVTVNNVRYERSVVVSPQSVSEWPVGAFEGLTAADFAFVATLKVEIVTRALKVEAFIVCSACRIRHASRTLRTAGDGSRSKSM